MVYLESQKMWNDTNCQTKRIIVLDGGKTGKVLCDCVAPGYVAVFLVKGNGEAMLMEEVVYFRKALEYTIAGDFNTIAGTEEKKKKFLASQRRQIADLLATDINNIKNVSCRPGSVVMSMLVESTDQVDAAELEKATDELKKMLQDGKVTLVDENGNPLDVPPQCLDNDCSVERTPEEDMVPYIVGGIAAAVVLIIIIILIVAVCVKNKKKNENKVVSLTVNLQQLMICKLDCCYVYSSGFFLRAPEWFRARPPPTAPSSSLTTWRARPARSPLAPLRPPSA